MSEAALLTTTEYDRTIKQTRQWITAVEGKVDTLRAEFDQFKLDIRAELAEAVAGLNQQILGNRLYQYPHTLPFIFPVQEVGTGYWNNWRLVDLSSWWATVGIAVPVKAVVFQVEARIWWIGPLQSGDDIRYFDVEFSGEATSAAPAQGAYAMPAPSRRVRVSGVKDDNTYADSVSQELTVPVFYTGDGKPYVRLWFGSNGGSVSRIASIAISGWKY